MVVIGAGVCGASTALELARAGRRVLVVDRAAGPGLGSTSASSAIVRYSYSTEAGVALAWESRFRWESWAEHLGYDDPQGMAHLVRCGMAFLDSDQFPRARMVPLLRSAGVPVEEWDAAELVRRVPGIDPGRYGPPVPVDSEEFFAPATGELGAVFTPDAGYVNDAQLAAANLCRAAEHHGARFRFRATVEAVGHERGQPGGPWELRLADGERVVAPVVVNAAGPWSSRVNALAGVGADFTVTFRALRQEVHRVELPAGLRGLPGGVPVLADLDLGIYTRPDSGDGLLVGGTEPECDPLEWGDDPDLADPLPSVARHEAHVLRAARRFPELAVPSRPRGIAGVYDVASDWAPVYDRTDRDGFYVAMGTSGNQFKNAPVIGEVMATLVEAVEDRNADHDVRPVVLRLSRSGLDLDLGAFSRRRPPSASAGNVFG